MFNQILSMKKKLLLEQVLKLKAVVEKSIETSYDHVLKYNFTDKKVDLILDRIEKLEVQLIIFKEVIQEANKGKIRGITNNFNIYTLSNLKAKREFYSKLLTKFNHSTTKVEKSQIKQEEATTKFNKLSEEISKLQNKLSTFNAKKKVTVYLDESLDLL